MRNAYQTRYGVIDPITNLVIGYVSNWCQLPFTMPVDTCVNGMITTGRSFGTMVKTVLANPAGAYKGMAAYSIAALKPAIQFTVFDQLKNLYIRFHTQPQTTLFSHFEYAQST